MSTGGATLPGYAKVPMQWVNTPNSGGAHLGSAYDGGFEGYLMSTFQQLLGQKPADGFGPELTSRECDGGPVTCHSSVDQALPDDVRRPREGQRQQQMSRRGPTRPSHTPPARPCPSTTRSSCARWASSVSRTSTGRTGRRSSRWSSSRGTGLGEVEWTSQLPFMLTR